MEQEIICENCDNWKIVQDVRREVPIGHEYIIYRDWMECQLGHREVVNKNCTDWRVRIEGE